MAQDGLNNGDNLLGYDPDDEYCPQCGREVMRNLFSLQAYCHICDSKLGFLKVKLGLDREPNEERAGCSQ